jgi:hypothetical protein
MWLAWGGDAGFSWSRKITQREKTMKKNLELNEIVEEIKDMLDDVVNPITKSIEIEIENEEDDMEDTEGCKCNGCMECKAAGGCDMEMCKGHDNMYKAEDLSDEEVSKSYESDNEEEDNWDNMEKACWAGYKQVGMKDKNGRRVPNCVPVKKSLFGTEGPQTLIPRNK